MDIRNENFNRIFSQIKLSISFEELADLPQKIKIKNPW
jgi:hypothetical protein